MDNPRQDFLCVLCADNGRREENKHGRPAPRGGEGPRGGTPTPCPPGDGHGVPKWRGGSHASPGTRGGRGLPAWAPRLHLTPGLRWLLARRPPASVARGTFWQPPPQPPLIPPRRGRMGGQWGTLQRWGLPHSPWQA